MNSSHMMIVLIVAIACFAGVIKARYKAQNGSIEDKNGYDSNVRTDDPEAAALRAEVKQLKDRLAVLERIATDGRKADELDREIEKLRLK